jgi:hypothetical protein
MLDEQSLEYVIARALANYNPVGFKYSPTEVLNCSYCDFAATQIDHVPPLSYVRNLLRSEAYMRYFELDLLLYPACSSCNSILGDLPIFNLEERRNYIKHFIRGTLRGS